MDEQLGSDDFLALRRSRQRSRQPHSTFTKLNYRSLWAELPPDNRRSSPLTNLLTETKLRYQWMRKSGMRGYPRQRRRRVFPRVGTDTLALRRLCGKSFGFRVKMIFACPISAQAQMGSSFGSGDSSASDRIWMAFPRSRSS